MNKQNSCFKTHVPYLPECKITQNQDHPKKVCLPRDNVFIQIYDDPPKISLLKEYFTIIFIHSIQKTCHILCTFTNQHHCLDLHTQACARARTHTHTHTHTPLTFPSSSLPFHNMSSLVSFTILDLQHFLKPFKVTPGETHCHAIMIHTD